MSDEPYIPTRLCCGQKHLGSVCPDGLVMCCLCFGRFSIDDLNANENGKKENICLECAVVEKTIERNEKKTTN